MPPNARQSASVTGASEIGNHAVPKGHERKTQEARATEDARTATLVPVMLSNVVIVAGMAHDWRTRGKPHSVWTIGLITLVGSELLRTPISASPAWLHFTDWLLRAS